jgi:xanthine/CO dehydrogenase XdhC/CoxF family maturation factor
MLDDRYVAAIEEACADAKEGERDKLTLPDRNASVGIDDRGRVEILVHKHEQTLFDALLAKSKQHARRGTLRHITPLATNWEITFKPR